MPIDADSGSVSSGELRVIPIRGLPEVRTGDLLTALIAAGIRKASVLIEHGDIIVAAQKIVSKAEGSTVDLSTVEPSERAREWAAEYAKDPRLVEVVLRESVRIVRMERGVL